MLTHTLKICLASPSFIDWFDVMKTFLKLLKITALLIFSTVDTSGQTVIFIDTFDVPPTNGATRLLSINNSATNGQFPGCPSDVFGIVDRNVNSDFADDSAINDDTFGLVSSEKTDLFLGFADTDNPDNPSGDVSVTWTVATIGQTGLRLSFDAAAIGDFEDTDILTFTASFDGGPEETLFTSTFIDTPDGDTFTYTLEDGSLAIPAFSNSTNIQDPFVIDGQTVINEFQSFVFPISGSGSQLTLTLNYNTNGGPEPLAIDNVAVTVDGGGGALKGDVNLDGSVTFLDINPFIVLLAANGFQAEADCDCDGDLDFLDIQPFINILAGQ